VKVVEMVVELTIQELLMMVDRVVVVLLMLVEVMLAALETDYLEVIHNHLHQIKDILVVLDMVLVQITLDLLEVVVVLMLPERMEAQIQCQRVVDMVVQEKQV
tara:strand:+ start:165 stop:473 length:309 start_codon:yes stop_codon:yes gene_type:complete